VSVCVFRVLRCFRRWYTGVRVDANSKYHRQQTNKLTSLEGILLGLREGDLDGL